MIEHFNTMKTLLPHPNEGVEKKGRKLKGCAFSLILIKIYSLSPIDFSEAKTPLSTAEIVTQYLFTTIPFKALYILAFMNVLFAVGYVVSLLGAHSWKIYQKDKPPFDPTIRSFTEIVRKDSSTIKTRWQKFFYKLLIPFHVPCFYFSKTITFVDKSVSKTVPLFWFFSAFMITLSDLMKLLSILSQILP